MLDGFTAVSEKEEVSTSFFEPFFLKNNLRRYRSLNGLHSSLAVLLPDCFLRSRSCYIPGSFFPPANDVPFVNPFLRASSMPKIDAPFSFWSFSYTFSSSVFFFEYRVRQVGEH